MSYATRLPADRVLQERIGYLLKRPVGRPPNHVRRYHGELPLSGWQLGERVSSADPVEKRLGRALCDPFRRLP
jgi:hypothetical protein